MSEEKKCDDCKVKKATVKVDIAGGENSGKFFLCQECNEKRKNLPKGLKEVKAELEREIEAECDCEFDEKNQWRKKRVDGTGHHGCLNCGWAKAIASCFTGKHKKEKVNPKHLNCDKNKNQSEPSQPNPNQSSREPSPRSESKSKDDKQRERERERESNSTPNNPNSIKTKSQLKCGSCNYKKDWTEADGIPLNCPKCGEEVGGKFDIYEVPASEKDSNRNLTPWLIGGVVLIIVAVGVIAYLLGKNKREEQ